MLMMYFGANGKGGGKLPSRTICNILLFCWIVSSFATLFFSYHFFKCWENVIEWWWQGTAGNEAVITLSSLIIDKNGLKSLQSIYLLMINQLPALKLPTMRSETLYFNCYLHVLNWINCPDRISLLVSLVKEMIGTVKANYYGN